MTTPLTPEHKRMADRQNGDYEVPVLSEPDDPEAPIPPAAPWEEEVPVPTDRQP